MRRITPLFVDIFAVRTPGAQRASMLLDILASLLGNFELSGLKNCISRLCTRPLGDTPPPDPTPK